MLQTREINQFRNFYMRLAPGQAVIGEVSWSKGCEFKYNKIGKNHIKVLQKLYSDWKDWK